MKPKDDFLILGFTGPFCSGCTTAAKFFENKLNEEKNNLILKKNEVDSLIANYYTNPPKEIIVSNDITKKKYIIRLLRERQIINALCKIQDHSFYYISMTDMMNSIMVIRFLNKSPAKTKLKEKYLKLIMFLESWCLENSLNKRDVNIIRKAIDKRDMKKAKEIFAYYDKIKSFRKDIHEAFKDCQNDLFSIMQDIGNNLRKSNYPFYDDEPFTSSEYLSILSEEAAALLKFERNYKKENSLNDNRTYYIIECLRNPSEIEYLRRRFYEFYLFSIYSEENVRTNRAKENYGLSYEDCMKVDKRDQGSNYIKAQFKQNVKQCVNIADISVTNNHLEHNFYRTLLKYFSLIKMPGCIKPTHRERNMHLAYSMSLNSTCISRQVGAVIVRKGDVVGAGWNDTEKDRQGCAYRLRSDVKRTDNKSFPISSDKDYTDFSEIILENDAAYDHSFCYKDEYGKLKKLKSKKKNNIPEECKEIIEEIDTKSLQQCRALHAEENAILQTSAIGGMGLSGATLYTTTFPCELCAKKILRIEIKQLIYCEPYPKSVSMDVFFKEGLRKINAIPFEGVKSPSYYRLFKSPLDIKESQELELLTMRR